jgi:hypothetical protein
MASTNRRTASRVLMHALGHSQMGRTLRKPFEDRRQLGRLINHDVVAALHFNCSPGAIRSESFKHLVKVRGWMQRYQMDRSALRTALVSSGDVCVLSGEPRNAQSC